MTQDQPAPQDPAPDAPHDDRIPEQPGLHPQELEADDKPVRSTHSPMEDPGSPGGTAGTGGTNRTQDD